MKRLWQQLKQGKWFFWLAYSLVRAYLTVTGRLRIHDADKVVRTGGLVIASNHFSAWDPPVLGVSVPREVDYMAKKELFEKPWLRLLMRGLQAFPVDRSRSDMSAIKEALRRLRDGVAVGIFVQGTRNAGDAAALDGAAFLAQRAGVPLQPAAIWREGRVFHVRFGDPIAPPQGRSREEIHALTEAVMAQIRAMLPPAEPDADATASDTVVDNTVPADAATPHEDRPHQGRSAAPPAEPHASPAAPADAPRRHEKRGP